MAGVSVVSLIFFVLCGEFRPSEDFAPEGLGDGAPEDERDRQVGALPDPGGRHQAAVRELAPAITIQGLLVELVPSWIPSVNIDPFGCCFHRSSIANAFPTSFSSIPSMGDSQENCPAEVEVLSLKFQFGEAQGGVLRDEVGTRLVGPGSKDVPHLDTSKR